MITGSAGFGVACTAVLAAGLLLNPVWRTGDMILALPVVLFPILRMDLIRRLRPVEQAILMVCACLLASQWLSAIALDAVGQWTAIGRLEVLPWLPAVLCPAWAGAIAVLVGKEGMKGHRNPDEEGNRILL